MKIKQLKETLAICERELKNINDQLKAFMPSFRPVLSPVDNAIRLELKVERAKLESLILSLKEKIDTAEMIG